MLLLIVKFISSIIRGGIVLSNPAKIDESTFNDQFALNNQFLKYRQI